eukprot:gene1439-2771_t
MKSFLSSTAFAPLKLSSVKSLSTFTRKMSKNPTSSSSTTIHRLERILSNRGVGSRNDVSKLLRQGRVTIKGEVIRSGASKYPTDIVVEIDGDPIEGVPLLAVYHKPTGIISSMGDPWGREALEELAYEFPFLKTMHPVGRLDSDTSGLLLFSSDGHLTQTLLNPASAVNREYEACVIGVVNADTLREKLANGVKTTEGTFVAKLLDAKPLDEPLDISKVKDLPPELADPTHSKLVQGSQVRLSVTEGKYRMVRRVMHNTGHSVVTLHRVSYGDILLGDLDEGEVRACTPDEKEWALQISKSAEKPEPVTVPVPLDADADVVMTPKRERRVKLPGLVKERNKGMPHDD